MNARSRANQLWSMNWINLKPLTPPHAKGPQAVYLDILQPAPGSDSMRMATSRAPCASSESARFLAIFSAAQRDGELLGEGIVEKRKGTTLTASTPSHNSPLTSARHSMAMTGQASTQAAL